MDVYKKNKDFILPLSRRNEVLSFVEKGLKDLSVSRTSFNWGIPVPKNKKHVIYVWLDALTNYISALDFPDIENKNYKNFWPADVHVIGRTLISCCILASFFISTNLSPPKEYLVMADFI